MRTEFIRPSFSEVHLVAFFHLTWQRASKNGALGSFNLYMRSSELSLRVVIAIGCPPLCILGIPETETPAMTRSQGAHLISALPFVAVVLKVFVLHPGITPLENDPAWLKITRFHPEMCLNGVNTQWVYSQGVIQKP